MAENADRSHKVKICNTLDTKYALLKADETRNVL